jgi:hypothetical protein
VSPSSVPNRRLGAWPLPVRPQRIELLNSRWHALRSARNHPGPCAACRAEIAAEERALYIQGEAYHADCAPDHRRRRL